MIGPLKSEYFNALGTPKPGHPFNLIDDYRFNLVSQYIKPGSVLDIGVYFGDFLKLVRRNGHQILGTEVNQERVNFANQLLGDKVVRLDFQNGNLLSFADQSVENVVCTEVIEHVPDDRLAISELCRVANRRVIITVPFDENIKSTLCVHCAQYTPNSGHLHSYNFDSFEALVPSEWTVQKQLTFGNHILASLIRHFHLPRARFLMPLVHFLEIFLPGRKRWLLVILSKQAS